MLKTAMDVATRVQEFLRRISNLETETEDTKKEVKMVKKDIDILYKRANANDKIQHHQGQDIASLEREMEKAESRIKELESKNRGLAISVGKAKAQNARLKA